MSLRPLVLQYRPDHGLWKISAKDGPPAHIQFPCFRLGYRRNEKRILLVNPDPAKPPADGVQRLAFCDDGIAVSITIRHDLEQNVLLIQGTVSNDSNDPVLLENLDLLYLDGNRGADIILGNARRNWAAFQNGWQSWSAAETLSIAEDRDTSPRLGFVRVQEENFENPGSGQPGRIRSEAVAAIVDRETGSGLLLGFITGANQFGDILLHLRPPRMLLHELKAALRFDTARLDPGSRIVSETLMLGFFDEQTDPLAAWADACGKAMNARVPEQKPIGWCSWYHYFRDISEPEMHKNLDRISALKDELPIRVVQLDDGYQRALGDWLEVNEKFPSGLQDLAHRIQDAGFVPGIWTAPFSCMRNSTIWREHPEWILRDERGKPVSAGFNLFWRGRYYGLDTTNPEVLEHIEFQMGRLAEWGFRFFKIDFVFSACLNARRHDPTSTRAQALRRGLEAVRRAIGESFLLGCGCPIMPAVGIIDCMRIGCDVAPRWDYKPARMLMNDRHLVSAYNAIRNTITRAFMHRRLWLNDPDCLLLRRTQNKLNEAETYTLASVIAASGGMILVSDAMDSVDPDRLEMAVKAAGLDSSEFRAVDLFHRRRPEKMLAMTPEGPLALIANFEDRRRTIEFDVAGAIGSPGTTLDGKDLFSGKPICADSGILSQNLPAHGSMAVLFPAVDPPKLAG